MRRIGIAALGLFLWMGVLPVHATNKLLIERVEPDLEQERLFIHGRYFGSQRGSVWLDYSALEVLDWSDQRIEAVLPSVTPPGTHRLLVERPGSSYLFAFRIDVMDVTLGAVGPQGAEGPEGQPGPEGPPGEMGLPGMDGEDGEPGEPGPPGPKGLNWRGAWVETEEYSRDDGVSHMGSSWIAHRGSTGVAPEEGEDWALLASRGEKGEQGAPGTPGEAGQQGPQGIPGPAGPQGIPGPPGGTVDPNGEFLRPEAPLDLVASAGQAGVALSWSPALGATSYTVKRSIAGSFGPYSSLATGLAASPYLDSSVEGETTYHYLVASVNPGAQTNSSPVAVTTSSSTPPGGNEAIALARITPDGPTTIEVSDVLVTFSSFSPLTQTTFFFVQAEQEGPALRVFYSGPTPPAPGDRVSFTIREMSTLQGGRVGGEIIDLAVVSEGNGVGAFLQDATNVDLVSQLDSYESELVRIENCVVVAVALVGGAWEVEFQTPGVPNPNGNLTLRFSSNLTPSITVGSAFHVAFAPVWRMNSRVQILVSDESQILQ